MAAKKTKSKKTDKAEKGASLIDRDKYQYEKRDVKTASGKRKVVDNGDRIAKAMAGVTTEDLQKIADKNGIEKKMSSYPNPGMARMNLGNMLRAKVRGGTKVDINGTVVASLGA